MPREDQLVLVALTASSGVAFAREGKLIRKPTARNTQKAESALPGVPGRANPTSGRHSERGISDPQILLTS
jgi:hypothetical protein